MANSSDSRPKDRRAQPADMEKRQAALKDGEGRSTADLDQLAQVGGLASDNQPDEAAESDPPKKRRP